MPLRCGGNSGFRLRSHVTRHVWLSDPLGPPFHECEVFLPRVFFQAFAVPSLKIKVTPSPIPSGTLWEQVITHIILHDISRYNVCKVFRLKRVQVVSHVGNIWVGPWANLPQYMESAFYDNEVSLPLLSVKYTNNPCILSIGVCVSKMVSCNNYENMSKMVNKRNHFIESDQNDQFMDLSKFLGKGLFLGGMLQAQGPMCGWLMVIP